MRAGSEHRNGKLDEHLDFLRPPTSPSFASSWRPWRPHAIRPPAPAPQVRHTGKAAKRAVRQAA